MRLSSSRARTHARTQRERKMRDCPDFLQAETKINQCGRATGARVRRVNNLNTIGPLPYQRHKTALVTPKTFSPPTLHLQPFRFVINRTVT